MNAQHEELRVELEKHLLEQPDEKFEKSRKEFTSTGFARVPYILPDSVKGRLAEEINGLLDRRSVRRDLELKQTGYSRRSMRNVTAADIRAENGWVEAVYRSEQFRAALGRVADEEVLVCPYEPEHYVITSLERSSDTHGWHWDDYSFGVIFVVDCPPLEDGGFVQCVSGTSWDKENPRLYRTLVENPIVSNELHPGDVYILRTDTTLHQVHPIRRGRRTIVNMAYAAERDLSKKISHETMEELFHVDS